MKMICPCCGLTGTAEAGLFERRVRCPGCRVIFRVTEEVVVGFPSEDSGVIKQSLDSAREREEYRHDDTSGHGSEQLNDRAAPVMCSRCGFILSGSFIKMIDAHPVCTACAG
jgi:hypothetical protein